MKFEYPSGYPMASFFLDLSKKYREVEEEPEILRDISHIVNNTFPERPVDSYKKHTSIIAVEGINGSLKSTILEKLTEWVPDTKSLRYRPDELNDPAPLNCQINKHFISGKSEKDNFINLDDLSLIEQTLLIVSYEAFVWERLTQNKEILGQPENILVDRMHDSSITIQSYLLTTKRISLKEATDFMINLYRPLGQPSSTLLLDFPVESCIERIKSRKRKSNPSRARKEVEELDTLYKLHKSQQELVKRNSDHYISVNRPSISMYWKDEQHTNYNLDNICEAIMREMEI